MDGPCGTKTRAAGSYLVVAAQCSGVLPGASCALISVPFAMNSLMSSGPPLVAYKTQLIYFFESTRAHVEPAS